MIMKWATLVLGVLLIGVVTFGTPLSLCSYHSPQTSLTDLKLSMSYRYFDNPAVPGVEVNSGKLRQTRPQLLAALRLSRLRVHSVRERVYRPGDFAIAGGLGQGSGTFHYYLSDQTPIFGFGGSNASYALGQTKPALNVSVGVGYGRFSDVTPLAKAVNIQKDLLALGTITDPLSNDTLMAIAKEIGKKVEYATIKDLVAAIEPIIEKAAGVTLGARALLTIEDDVLATGDKASCGWALQAGLGYELMDPYGGTQDVLVTISGDASLAPTPGSQLTLHGTFYSPFDIAAENTLTVSATYDYALKEDVNLVINGWFWYRSAE